MTSFLRPHRRRAALPLACLAWLLNLLAPALAYAGGQPLHELAGGHRGTSAGTVAMAGAVLAAHTHDGARDGVQGGADVAVDGQHHAVDGEHAHHPAAQTAPVHGAAHHPKPGASDAPVTPHCVYCPDFAAGAALAPVLLLPAAAAPRPIAAPPLVERDAPTRASIRLASPRAPPASA